MTAPTAREGLWIDADDRVIAGLVQDREAFEIAVELDAAAMRAFAAALIAAAERRENAERQADDLLAAIPRGTA